MRSEFLVRVFAILGLPRFNSVYFSVNSSVIFTWLMLGLRSLKSGLCTQDFLVNFLGYAWLNLDHSWLICMVCPTDDVFNENRVASKFKKLPQCENMLNVHCICHWLALACADAGDNLQFIKDFKTTMILGLF